MRADSVEWYLPIDVPSYAGCHDPSRTDVKAQSLAFLAALPARLKHTYAVLVHGCRCYRRYDRQGNNPYSVVG